MLEVVPGLDLVLAGPAAPIIGAVASALVSNALTKEKKPSAPEPAPVPSPAPAPTPDLTAAELGQKAAGAKAPTAPGFLGLSPQMNTLQQRTAIATGGTQSEDSRYRDPATVEFYRNLALTDLVSPTGEVRGQPTDIEKQYAQSLGLENRGDTTESFLSALLRG